MANRVTVSGLTKRYGGCAAVTDVSFDVAAGEVFGLLGANGAGKTTTIECLLGLRRPDAGTIALDGIDLARDPAAARAVVGAQLQTAALQDKITPREALRLFAAWHGIAGGGVAQLAAFGLEAKADAAFDTLSGGMRQRVLLALAFVHRPRVVLLDEPTAGLDPLARRELQRLIRAGRDDGQAVLLSTHYLDEAARLCDRIGILQRGRLVALGTPDELVARATTAPKVVVRTDPALPVAAWSALPGVTAVTGRRGRWECSTADVGATVAGVAETARRAAAAIVELHVARPTLEDVLFELTGDPWDADAGEVAP